MRYACEAGTLAGRQLAFDDAASAASSARSMRSTRSTRRGPVADLLRASVLAQLAMAEHDRGDAERGRNLALEAATLARRHGDAVQLAEAGRAYQGYLGMWARPDDGIAIEIMQEALALLGDTEPEVRARAKAGIAYGLILAPGDAGSAPPTKLSRSRPRPPTTRRRRSRSLRARGRCGGTSRPANGSRPAEARRRRGRASRRTGTGCNPPSGTSGTRCSSRATSRPRSSRSRAARTPRARSPVGAT